ncbi:MAG: radical SAM protein [Candidatus Omnitrophota bacterium]
MTKTIRHRDTQDRAEVLPLKSVQVMLTNKCNLQCRICNIYREKNKTTLSLSALKNLIQFLLRHTRRLECLNLTGGEPTLEYRLIIRLLQTVVPLVASNRIREFNINTNASLLAPLKAITSVIPNALKNRFSFSVTLHGWKEDYSPCGPRKRLFWDVTRAIAFLRSQGHKVDILFVVSPWTHRYVYRAYQLARTFDCGIEYAFYTTQTRSFYHYDKPLDNGLETDGWKKESAWQWDRILDEGAVKCRKYQIVHLRDFMKGRVVPDEVFRRCLRPQRIIFVRCTGEIYTCFQSGPVSRFKKLDERDWQNLLSGREKLMRDIKKHGCRHCLLGALKWDHSASLKKPS